MRTVTIMLIAGTILSGCSDPKKANESNFSKAIDAYFTEEKACINAPTGGVKPAGQDDKTTDFSLYVMEKPMFSFGNGAEYIDALVTVGLLKMKTGTVSVEGFGGKKDTAVKIYELTDAGTKAFSKPDPEARGKFCYGTPQVDEVTQFTEPAAMFGMTVSQVNFTYHIENQADWANSPVLQKAYPNLKKNVGKSLTGKATLLLTNNGWVHNELR